MGKIKRVVSVGAHSFDAEIMGGPLVLKYAREGAHCTFMHITQGRLEDPNATEEEKKAYLNKLLAENETVAKSLGADCLWIGYVSNNMPSLDDFAKDLEDYFEKEKVDLVITHWRGSMHPRHINTHDACVQAVKALRKKGNPIRLIYGENFEDLVGFIPQAYFVMSEEEYDTWWKALYGYTLFQGGVNDFPYHEYYSTIGRVRQIESDSTGYTKAYMYASLIEDELW